MRKIKWKDDKDLFGRMYELTNHDIFKNLRNAVDHYEINLNDCLSWGQLKSKRWLVDELKKLNINLGTVFLCAGWYGTLAHMLLDEGAKIKCVRSFDIDSHCEKVADTVCRHWVVDGWKFKASTADIHNITYPFAFKTKRYDGTVVELNEMPNTLINTSCEHIDNFDKWYNNIPDNMLLIVQNNNFFDMPTHINCVQGLSDFSRATPMKKVLFEGELELTRYTRYMRIGFK